MSEQRFIVTKNQLQRLVQKNDSQSGVVLTIRPNDVRYSNKVVLELYTEPYSPTLVVHLKDLIKERLGMNKYKDLIDITKKWNGSKQQSDVRLQSKGDIQKVFVAINQYLTDKFKIK